MESLGAASSQVLNNMFTLTRFLLPRAATLLVFCNKYSAHEVSCKTKV